VAEVTWFEERNILDSNKLGVLDSDFVRGMDFRLHVHTFATRGIAID
jgi:hypothetical protein